MQAAGGRKSLSTRIKEFARTKLLIYEKAFAFANFHYFLDPHRVYTKGVSEEFEPIGANHIKIGNYYLDKRCELGPESVVYSLGVGNNIGFDLEMARNYDCDVWMYDPDPRSIEYMQSFKDHEKLKFFDYGVWTCDGSFEFNVGKYGGSASMIFPQPGGYSFQARCREFLTVVKENGHDYIDVLKLDVEGAAIPIVRHVVQNGIFPKQIVLEVERPKKGYKENVRFWSEFIGLIDMLNESGYTAVRLPRGHARYYSLELLLVKGLDDT